MKFTTFSTILKTLSLKSFLNIGVSPNMSSDEQKRVRIQNRISLMTIIMGFVALTYCILYSMDSTLVVFSLTIILISVIPWILNYAEATIFSRLFYLTTSYGIILCLPILFGLQFHYQYFLVAGVGMPFIFISPSRPILRWIYSIIGIPIFLFIHWYLTDHDPVITIETDYVLEIRTINDLMLFATIIYMFHLYASISGSKQ